MRNIQINIYSGSICKNLEAFVNWCIRIERNEPDNFQRGGNFKKFNKTYKGNYAKHIRLNLINSSNFKAIFFLSENKGR